MSKKTTMTNAAALATMQSQLAELAQKLLESEAKAAQMETERKAEQERLASLPPTVRKLPTTGGYITSDERRCGMHRNGLDGMTTAKCQQSAAYCLALLQANAVSLASAKSPSDMEDAYTRLRISPPAQLASLPVDGNPKARIVYHVAHNLRQSGSASTTVFRPIGGIEGRNKKGSTTCKGDYLTAEGLDWLASLGFTIDPAIRAQAQGAILYFADDGSRLPAPIQIPVVKAPVVEEKPVIKPSPRKRQPVKV